MISCSYISVKNIVLIAMAIAFTFTSFSTAFENQKKVQIEFYCECQYPDCREMISTSFKEAYQPKSFLVMADILFVPYGNAEEE